MILIKNRYFQVFAALYTLAITVLIVTGVYSIAEPLFILVIFGIVLPSIAYFLCRKCTPISTRINVVSGELRIVLLYVVLATFFLLKGGEWIDALVYWFIQETPRFNYFLNIAKKLVVFVVVPYLLLSRGFGYSWRDFGFSARFRAVFAPRYLVLMGVFFVLYFLIQFLVGQGAQTLFKGELPFRSILLGSLLLFPLLVLEVGLVEEFFFRAVVQARLAAWSRSELAGLFMMALVFGLAHAPGLYLRGAGAVTLLGESPGLLQAVSYSIAVLALAGLAFGVIWAKTKNLLVLMLIHAWLDLFPQLPEFIRIFGI